MTIPYDTLAGVVEAARQQWHVPGLALGILHNGETYTAGFGVTSVENPLLVDADTLFQIGSITKTFTGTAAMRLVERGMLDLDTPIRAYLPDLRLSSEELTAQITLRHLFTHTSGWEGDYFDDYGSGDDALARYVADMGALPQWVPMGTLWSYNNAGFNLAGRVIEVVAGKPYETVVRELIFEPLGMTRTTFFPAEAMTYRFSVGHVADDPPKVARPWPLARVSNAAGAIASTINDLLRYARLYLNGGVTDSGERLLNPETIALMHSELFSTGSWGNAVGVTWYLRDIQHVRLIGHGGSTNGFQATLQLAPAQNFVFIALTNASNGSALYGQILNWTLEQFLGVKEPKRNLLPLSDEELSGYVGRYSAALDEIEITLKEHQLWAQVHDLGGFPVRSSPPDSPPAPPVRLSFYEPDKGLFINPPRDDARVEFLRDASGRIEWLRAGGRIHRPT